MITQIQKEKVLNLLKLYKCFGMKYMEPLSFHTSIKSNRVLPQNFRELQEYIQHCNLCDLSKICRKNTGLHEITNNIYIVGFNCNFSDATAQNYLKFLIETVLGYAFKEVYMTNIIKCETNSHKEQYDYAASQCKEYVFQEITIGKPKYILATQKATKYILKIKNSVIGESYKLGESTIFPIYDLDFLSKNPSYQEEMVRVFQKIKGLIH